MSDQSQWNAVDQYFIDRLFTDDEALGAALRSSAAAGLPPINVSPNQGKLLWLLARMCGARKILEVGTLGGYSSIWMGRALPEDGKLITLESDPRHAAVATENIARAGLSKIVEVRLGPALDSLPVIESQKPGPFDLVFIDADKPSNADYFEWALKLTRPGSVIIVDNVVRNGAVVEANLDDPRVNGVHRLTEMLSRESRVSATAIQTVGTKGYDGFLIALVSDTIPPR